MTTQPNESTVSLQSVTTVSSSTPLAPRPRQPTKDYAAALSALQSRYGSAGTIPSPKKEPSKKLPESPRASPSTSHTPSNRNDQINPGDSQATLASSSVGSDTANSDSGGSAGLSDATPVPRKASKSKAGSILKSIFKGLSHICGFFSFLFNIYH